MPKRVEMACRDCKRCTNAAIAEGGRRVGRAGAAIATVGMSELGFAMKKTCRLCGHQMSLHGGVNAPPPTVQVVPGQPAWVQPVAQTAPDAVTVTRAFPFVPGDVYLALIDAVAAAARPQGQDPILRSVTFATKVSAMSWGANLTAVVQQHEAGATINITGAPKVATQQGALGAATKHANALLDHVMQLLVASGVPRAQIAPPPPPEPESPAPRPSPTPSGEPQDDLVDKLARLADLQASGVLTAEEFAAAKARLLGS